MKSKQLSYCKFWGAFKINGSDAIASFGGIFLPPSYSRFKFQIQKAIASFGGEFSPHQIPDLKSYCKFWGESFSLMKSKQLSYCKIWGTFKINGSEAIASFGGKIFTTIKFLI